MKWNSRTIKELATDVESGLRCNFANVKVTGHEADYGNEVVLEIMVTDPDGDRLVRRFAHRFKAFILVEDAKTDERVEAATAEDVNQKWAEWCKDFLDGSAGLIDKPVLRVGDPIDKIVVLKPAKYKDAPYDPESIVAQIEGLFDSLLKTADLIEK